MDDRAGKGASDARYALNLRDDQAAEIVDIVRLGPDYDVVRPGDVVGLSHSGNLPDLRGYVGRLADLRLDEDVSLHHFTLHASRVTAVCQGNATVGTSGHGNGRRLGISVADLGEFGLISAIAELLPPDPHLTVPAGDDAAVLAVPDGRVVATTDLLVEGRHFRRDWSGPRDVGVKAAAQNLADVAAMGAQPRTLLLGLACPASLESRWVLDMVRGMVAECGRAGASIAGGDVTAAGCIMLGITALGELTGGQPPVTRAGARPGDVVALAGRLGWSAAGLALLRSGVAPSGQDVSAELAGVIAAHLRPQPPYPAGPAARAAGATAMVDVSDGLLQDLGHVASASHVSVSLDAGLLPVAEPIKAAAKLLGTRSLDWVLGGGEDHALVATFPANAALPAGWSVVGEVIAGAGILVDGALWDGPVGWDHFR
jgi:thiamine-monophosphate kinase